MNFLRNAFPLLLLISAALLFQSCSDNAIGLDFSQAPAPFDTSQAVRDTTLSGGIDIFVLEEGEGLFEVVSRDIITVRFTGRTESGEIFDSSFNNRSVGTSRVLANLSPSPTTGGQLPLIEGFRKGLLGMKEGERRTIIVPPDMGYSDSRPGTNGFDLRGERLIYDVELVAIR